MEKRSYTVVDKVCLDLELTRFGLLVFQIKPRSKVDMHAILGSSEDGDGQYAICDAYPDFLEDGGIRLVGFSGPNGGDPDVTVEITIPFEMVDQVKIQKA